MKASVDPDLCTGCEICTEACPAVFVMQGDLAVAKVAEVPPEAEDDCQNAADSCPVEAISIE